MTDYERLLSLERQMRATHEALDGLIEVARQLVDELDNASTTSRSFLASPLRNALDRLECNLDLSKPDPCGAR